MKKLISLIFSILLICSISVPSLATDSSNTSPVVTQFKYTIFDADGNVKSTGITPDFSTRYSWSGITLENGESVNLQKTDGTNFFVSKDSRITYEISKDRRGTAFVYFVNPGVSTGLGGLAADYTSFDGFELERSFYIPDSTNFEHFDYYYLMIQSAASDPMTFTNITLTF